MKNIFLDVKFASNYICYKTNQSVISTSERQEMRRFRKQTWDWGGRSNEANIGNGSDLHKFVNNDKYSFSASFVISTFSQVKVSKPIHISE